MTILSLNTFNINRLFIPTSKDDAKWVPSEFPEIVSYMAKLKVITEPLIFNIDKFSSN